MPASNPGPPNIEVVLSHALLIKINGKTPVGCVNEWQPRQNQTLTDMYAFGGLDGTRTLSRGAPCAIAPGNIGQQSITVRRYDLYKAAMEEVFGDPIAGMNMLGDQNDPFLLQEIWQGPTNFAVNWTWIYEGCWFEQIGRTMSSTGDRIVNVDATIRYLGKSRVRTG